MFELRSTTKKRQKDYRKDLTRRESGTFIYENNVPKLPPPRDLDAVFKAWPTAPRSQKHVLNCLTEIYFDQDNNQKDVYVKGSLFRRELIKIEVGKPITWRIGAITDDGNCYFHAITALVHGTKDDDSWVIVKAQHLKR